MGKFYKVSDFLPKCDAVGSVMEIDYERSLVPLLSKGDSSEEETCVMIVFSDGHFDGQLSMDTKSKLIMDKMLSGGFNKLTVSRKVSFDGLLGAEFKAEPRASYTSSGHLVNMFVVRNYSN